MNAFDKINPETAELMEGQVVAEAPAPGQAPPAPAVVNGIVLQPGEEVVRAEIVYGSCHYYALIANKDGSHVSRQHPHGDLLAPMHEGQTGYFRARHNGLAGPSSSEFQIIEALNDQNW